MIFKTLQEDGSWIEQDIRSYQIYVDDNPYVLGNEMDAGIYEVKLIGKRTFKNCGLDI